MKSSYLKFFRSFTLLHDGVDAENINASCENGVLEVVVPKLREKSEKKEKDRS
ncbi:Hsp20/alpha crystallin family protein [Sulfurimonas xiamenensis]|uniref:Hsp20/alpha crystallin family protein n=1 Tax=Sulfurimonas xiamenensis TaxID=2590021 RepID=A0AAJ4A5H3_9BACT|nr:Hsp20/alpha crystallin family protein [Sulfurimonas xiamenensis]